MLRLIAAGICNTDLELQRGYYQFEGTPGHEFVARVVACDDPKFLGQRVVGEINLACVECDFCGIGMGRHCRNRTVLGIVSHPGAFAEYFTLPEANLHIVPDGITDEEAVFTEPLAAACEILDQRDLPRGTEVALIGDGKLGLLITQVLVAAGWAVTVYGRHETKLQLARAFGAQAVMAGKAPRAPYMCVVECSGSAEGLSAAIQMTRPRGTVVMKSTIQQQVSIDMAPVVVNEISLVGSRCGRFEPALALLADRRVNVRPMISAEFGLEDAPVAFEAAARSGVLKILLRNRTVSCRLNSCTMQLRQRNPSPCAGFNSFWWHRPWAGAWRLPTNTCGWKTCRARCALAWVKTENERSAMILESDPKCARLEATALKVLESPERLPMLR